mmetsp:Transcript_5823/g.11557  ORF Transcript_5823/g.11557 Transcript_5823/m.11557 type:complete len:229 (-) Transcript_5823:286-972(-)
MRSRHVFSHGPYYWSSSLRHVISFAGFYNSVGLLDSKRLFPGIDPSPLPHTVPFWTHDVLHATLGGLHHSSGHLHGALVHAASLLSDLMPKHRVILRQRVPKFTAFFSLRFERTKWLMECSNCHLWYAGGRSRVCILKIGREGARWLLRPHSSVPRIPVLPWRGRRIVIGLPRDTWSFLVQISRIPIRIFRYVDAEPLLAVSGMTFTNGSVSLRIFHVTWPTLTDVSF